jgi:outer membrane protein OmpA-like peptidoglycan-associated protein
MAAPLPPTEERDRRRENPASNHKTSVTVIVCTDAVGNAAANRRLSLERARRVVILTSGTG